MKDPKTLITTAAGLLVVGIGTWLITTTADSTVGMATVDKDIETIAAQIEDIKGDLQDLENDIDRLKAKSHDHDKRGNVVK
jgi:peptidoglycan hydrolase CwlO-like protein